MYRKILIIIGIVILGNWKISPGTDIYNNLSLKIRDKVICYVFDHVKADSMDLQVQVPATVVNGIRNSDVTDIHVDWRRGEDALAGRVVVPVRIRTKGNHFFTTYATATIRVFERVYVTRKLLNRHHVIAEHDLTKEMREVTKLESSVFVSQNTLVDRRTRRVIGKGRIITQDMVEAQPLVRQGDRVSLTLVYGNLKVKTTGFARKDGWKGDRIRVRSPKNRSEIVGMVVSKKEVIVQL